MTGGLHEIVNREVARRAAMKPESVAFFFVIDDASDALTDVTAAVEGIKATVADRNKVVVVHPDITAEVKAALRRINPRRRIVINEIVAPNAALRDRLVPDLARVDDMAPDAAVMRNRERLAKLRATLNR
jgi:hypothetical protein